MCAERKKESELYKWQAHCNLGLDR